MLPLAMISPFINSPPRTAPPLLHFAIAQRLEEGEDTVSSNCIKSCVCRSQAQSQANEGTEGVGAAALNLIAKIILHAVDKGLRIF